MIQFYNMFVYIFFKMGWFNHQLVIPGKVAKARVADAEADAEGSRSETSQKLLGLWVGFFRGVFPLFLWGLGKPFSGEATVRLCWGG